jgi:hypothetical protein
MPAAGKAKSMSSPRNRVEVSFAPVASALLKS